MLTRRRALVLWIGLAVLLMARPVLARTLTVSEPEGRVVEARLTGTDMTEGLLPSVSGHLDRRLTGDGTAQTEAETMQETEAFRLGAASSEDVRVRRVSLYEDVALPTVEGALNVRVEASENADIAGRLYRGSEAKILEAGDEWTLIESGDVTGYILNEYYVTAEDAEAAEEELKGRFVTITADKLRLREKAGTDSQVLADVTAGETFAVRDVTENGQWAKIQFTSKITGYVSLEYAEMSDGFIEAVSAQEEKERQASYDAYEKEREEAARLARLKAKGYTIRKAFSLSESEILLVAAVCDCEAGRGDSCYENQLAVANVILSRLRKGSWGSSVRDVVYARGQFTVVASGKMQRDLDRGPSASAIRAVRTAASGVNNIGGYLYFVADFAAKTDRYSSYRFIGDNCFYSRR